MKLSVDIGNGYVKAVNEAGATLHFPTVIRENKELRDFGNGRLKYSAKINGKDYYFGNMAISKRGARNWGTNNDLADDTGKYVALCGHLLSVGNENDIDLFLGIPYVQYMRQADSETKLTSLKGKVYETTTDEGTTKTKVASVSICPQGIGAYFYNIADMNGIPRSGAKNLMKALVIDVGYGTIDVVAFDGEDGSFVLVHDNSFSMEEQGIYNVVMNMRDAIKGTGLDFKVDDIEKALQKDGKLEYIDGTFDLKPYEDKELELLAREIYKKLKVDLKDDLILYNNVYLTGGGANKLYPFLKKIIPSLQLQEDYIFCNCKGYLALANS